ncbi:primosomal protein N' [Planktothrix mougeotii]|uniref:Replication restart protein PriA n=1 Tax=Planktothrix mougeotii LEGE 06226 TaxID=1828728 RepID=A0ABR9U800_9CYAN|nr:primosomal protein N' [Planktothrix mougeotii]MBE9142596.1 primosomal protein N' [Planktothrix mougeotii LEGE 06226]
MSSLICDQSKFIVAEPGASYSQDNSGNSVLGSERFVEVLVDIPIKNSKFNQEKAENQEEKQQVDLRENYEKELAVDIQEEKLYIYRVPSHLDVQPGDIVSVSFNSQQLGVIVIRYISQLPNYLSSDRVKDIDDILCKEFFPSTYWQLLQQVANYYQTSLFKVVRVAFPCGLLAKSKRRICLSNLDSIPREPQLFLKSSALHLLKILQSSATGNYSWKYLKSKVRNAEQGLKDLLQRGWVKSYLEPPDIVRPKLQLAATVVEGFIPVDLTPLQRHIIKVIKEQGGEIWVTHLLKICNTDASTLQRLREKGCIIIANREFLRQEQGIFQTPDQPKVLNQYQTESLQTINSLSGYAQVLLHGVTGSGKTEVYLQAIAPILTQGKSALVLVPEIGLTPQLTDRFRARFGDQVFVYHSALSDGERYDTWRNMTLGLPQIIIGTRSAIFAPLPKLGLIILDEEHDSSFKQDQPSPCYHARKVAQWRAELENCPLILGSATPSLESWLEIKHKTQQNRFYLSLPERIQARPLPPIKIVDMRQELRQGNRSIFSYDLQTALHQLKETRQQGILFIHRRGHSTFVSCRSCGYVMECPHCDVSLAYHHEHPDAAQLLRCHYCNYSQLYPQRCPDCDSPYFKHFGSGTQRVTEELNRLFPEFKCIRFDSDTTSRKNAHRTLLTQFANGEADLLVGTQMLTKGLDLASVSLVGIVSADGLLHLSDYRASERAFQTLVQVAGRAGRGNDPGRVILQTYTPEHPVIQAVQRHDYESFVATELQQRQELNYPPFGRLILLRLSSFNQQDVEETAKKLAEFLLENNLNTDFELLGPAPAPILRVANRYRWQILIKTSQESSIILPKFSEFNSSSVYITIDIDPLHL